PAQGRESHQADQAVAFPEHQPLGESKVPEEGLIDKDGLATRERPAVEDRAGLRLVEERIFGPVAKPDVIQPRERAQRREPRDVRQAEERADEAPPPAPGEYRPRDEDQDETEPEAARDAESRRIVPVGQRRDDADERKEPRVSPDEAPVEAYE